MSAANNRNDPRVLKRRNNSPNIDPNASDLMSYNDQAGVKKVSDFGKVIKPLKLSETTFTTDFSTLRSVGTGKAMAFYNNSAAVASVTIGIAGTTSLAAGATTSTGIVGVPVPPNEWLYLNTYDQTHVIVSAVTCLGFIIEDDTGI